MAATPHDTTGTVLTWAGTTYTVTNIVITASVITIVFLVVF